MIPKDSASITTTRLTLVPVSTAYAQDIFREFTPRVTRFMFPKSPERLEDTLTFIEQSVQQYRDGTALNVSIIKTSTGEFIGGGGLNHLDSHSPELGIWIKVSAHGHKYGREAVAGMASWAETHLRYNHLVYPADERNIASRKIAESLGGLRHREYDCLSQSGNQLHMIEYWIPRPEVENR